ncbi:MAG TPA: alpha-amylase family glycosyl hydrolase [Candidatus Saccharimonas sp.]|nr:alpha-amylase family glycosyl hydrolase [Candidatus Saccharimonas sp.]
MTTWRNVNAIYQIYPRSFMDGNADGVGDLRGVIEKLDYLRGNEDSLGVDAIWFSPIFPSPMADMGYDVSDYCGIDPTFGTIDDFKELVKKAHARGMNVMIDYVPNHSSDRHAWFQESRKSRSNPYHDYYVWKDPAPGGGPPNNWISIFGGSAWEFDASRKQYYLHTFLASQPDLNWDNPTVREEMKNVLRFWLDIGVDGIRADAVRWLSKDPKFRDDPRNKLHTHAYDGASVEYDALVHKYSRFWKNLFPYLRELTDVIAEYENRIMIFEDYPDANYSTKEQYLGFYSINPKVSMPFNFEGVWTDFYADAYRTFITEFQGMLNPDEHTPVYCFGNHDQSRIVSRMGGEAQARLIAVMQMSLPGLPTIYYGDEIGMPDTPIAEEDIKDLRAFTSGDITTTRDPERTPMQWNAREFAGFSTETPWLPIGRTLSVHNVDTQQREPDSFLALYRRLLKLRSQHDILRNGTYEAFGELEADVFMFARWLGDQHVFVALNFATTTSTVQLPHSGRILCCTHPVDYPDINDDGQITLRPYEGVIVECREHPLVSA